MTRSTSADGAIESRTVSIAAKTGATGARTSETVAKIGVIVVANVVYA